MKKIKNVFISAITCLIILSNLFNVPEAPSVFHQETVYAASISKLEASDAFPLIIDSKKVDYMSYIPSIDPSDTIETALDVKNPNIKIDAASAILFNAQTGEVLFYKNATAPVFPASTAKLLTSLVALDFYKTDELVKVGDEAKLIPEDASDADLKKGEVLTVYNLLSGMLLPSGSDAAYVIAVRVGRKSLHKSNAGITDAFKEFTRLMNKKAKALGAENSYFITPDGYDAIGQYTTAYDMGRIGLAAAKNKTISKIANYHKISASLKSGERLTWYNTNSLIDKNSEWYNSNVVGLKTGTTTMAGKCLISAAKSEDGTVVSVVMNSSLEGRWKDTNKLLNYGLKKLK